MSRFNNENRPEILAFLLEKQGGICAGEGCHHVFTSVDEMRIDHEDNCENHNCSLNFKRLLCNSCNTAKGLAYKALVQKRPEFDTSWLRSDYSNYGFNGKLRRRARPTDRVCVSAGLGARSFEIGHEVSGISECYYIREVKPPKPKVYSIIPRDRQDMDDSQDTDTSSQSSNKRNQPKYYLYFMLQVKLGYPFKATDAKSKFALILHIPHGTIKNHYYSTMKEYFERDESGYFIDRRKPDARPFLEEQEISWLMAAYRQNKVRDPDCWKVVQLYSEVLEVEPDVLLDWFKDAPALMRPEEASQ